MEATAETGAWKDFSLVQGGPLYRLGRLVGLSGGYRGLVLRGPIIGLTAWLPLLVLSAVDGRLVGGVAIPFVDSLGTHARLLVTIPAFSLAEAMFDARVRRLIRALVLRPIVPVNEQPKLEAALAEAIWWRNSGIVELALVLLVALLLREGLRSDLPAHVDTWRGPLGGPYTLAGQWYRFVSMPIFQFLLWRWCARLLIWLRLVWRISRLQLRLIPTHPDLAAGLGSFGVSHLALWPLLSGVSAMIVATFAEQVAFGGVDVHTLIVPVASMIVGLTALAEAPLLLFIVRLTDVKERGLHEYGGLAESYVSAFDTKWLRGPAAPNEPLLGSADIQSLADLSNSFSVIRDMRVVPITPTQVTVLALAAAAPAAPLVLFVAPWSALVLRSLHAMLPV
jgi:hypothetical protein